MNEELRHKAGAAWAFRERVERDAARRFARLAAAIGEFDPASPVPAMLLRAVEDERRHASLCAELCASYGYPLEAGLPPEQIAPPVLSRRQAVLYEMVAACCITETESVATLTTLLAAEVEPAVRDVLHEIARDEVGHARMGWAHLSREAPAGVAFLSAQVPAMLSGSIDAALFGVAEGEPSAAELLRHGVLPRSQKRDVFVGALEGVILPGLERFGIDAAPARAWLAARRSTSAPPGAWAAEAPAK